MATLTTPPSSKPEKETSENLPSDTGNKNESPSFLEKAPRNVAIYAVTGAALAAGTALASVPVATLGVAAAAMGAGYAVGKGIQAVFPKVPDVLANMADVAINGHPSDTHRSPATDLPSLKTEDAITAGFAISSFTIGFAPTAAFASGVLAGEVAKLVFPDLQPAVDKLADRLINGKDTFAPESNVATSTTEPPKFASKVSEQSAKTLSSQGKVEDGSDLSLPRASTQRNSPVAQANEREID